MKKFILMILIAVLAVFLLAPVALAGPPIGTKTTFIVDHDGDYATVKDSGAFLAVGVTYPHHEIHEGNSYCFGFNNTLASGAATTFLINTPSDGTFGHIVFSLRSSGESNVKIYEDVTASALGSAIQSTQHNRNSINNSTIEITLAPTVTSLGNSLDGFEVHVGAGNNKGGEARGISELVMKPGSLYLMNVISEAANNDVTGGGDYYQDSGDAP